LTVLAGVGSSQVQFVPGSASGNPANGSIHAPAVAPSTTLPDVIDGTPVRVVVLALSAAAGIMALHMAGFRFNLGVSA
jgi:hypothetical protein